jgi:hypothetical protein
MNGFPHVVENRKPPLDRARGDNSSIVTGLHNRHRVMEQRENQEAITKSANLMSS